MTTQQVSFNLESSVANRSTEDLVLAAQDEPRGRWTFPSSPRVQLDNQLDVPSNELTTEHMAKFRTRPSRQKSLLTQVSEAHLKSNEFWFVTVMNNLSEGPFTCKSAGILIVSLIVLLCQVLFYTIPVAMMAIGSTHLTQCPVARIPLLLIIGGAINAMRHVVNLILWRSDRKKDTFCISIISAIAFIYSVLNYAWLIGISVLVYKEFKPDFNCPHSKRFCNKFVYLFAFWYISPAWLIIVLFVIPSFLCVKLGRCK